MWLSGKQLLFYLLSLSSGEFSHVGSGGVMPDCRHVCSLSDGGGR